MAEQKNKNQKLLIPYYSSDNRISPLSLTKDSVLNKSIVDKLDSDVIVLDKDLAIVLMNKSAENTWGVQFEDVKGTSYLSLKLKAIEKELADNLAEVVKEKKTITVKELQVISPDNVTRFLDLSCMPILDENGQIQGAVSVSRDVTNKVQKDIKLQETQRLLQSLNHDLDVKEKEIESLHNALKGRYHFHSLIGKNYQMQRVYTLIERIAQTNTTILITGETGTGKELVVKAIHFSSPRADNNLVTVNCAALPETLLESELFGHVKGAFTGAVRDKKGKFEIANKGTLFLDEIGELSISTQVKLLRALQEREVEKVGGEKKIRVDIRILAATNQDLLELIDQGKFRKDLYYRLHVISVKLPALRDRSDDIPLLITHFIERFNKEFDRDILGISPYALKKCIAYDWPGNVRELEGVIEKGVLLEDSTTIQDVDLPVVDVQNKDFFSLPLPEEEGPRASYQDMVLHLEGVERQYFLSVFKEYNGKIGEIAEFTGLNRRSILNKMKKFAIKKSDFK